MHDHLDARQEHATLDARQGPATRIPAEEESDTEDPRTNTSTAQFSAPFPRSALNPATAPTSPDKIIYDYLRNMAIDVLLQVVQELTGFGASGELPALGILVREVPKICKSASTLEEKVHLLTQQFYNVRQNIGEASPLYGTVNALYKVSDILRQLTLFRPVTGELMAGKKKPSDLKEPLRNLLASLPDGFAGINDETLVNLLECLDTYQHLKSKNAPNTEIIKTLVLEKLTPEQLSRPLNIAGKIAEKIRAGELKVQGLPSWPQGAASDMNVISARLAWLMDVLENPGVEEKLDELLTVKDAAFVRENLMVFAKAAREFPSGGSVFEKWEAIRNLFGRVPLLSGALRRADIKLQPALGEYGEVLKDEASVMRLLDAAMSTGTAYEKGKKLTGMIDYSALATKGAREVGKLALKTLHWSYQPLLLAGTKAWEYRNSAYSVNWVTEPRMVYSSVRDYLKEDFAKNSRDYEQLLVGGDIPNRLMKVAFASNQIDLPENPTTAEYLEAYAAAGSKLTSKTEWLFQRWLEVSMVVKISRAISRGESNQAREDLEAMSRTLRRYAQDGVFAGLAPLAEILPYIPAMKEAWDELASINEEQRENMQVELEGRHQALQTLQNVVRVGKGAKPDELAAMQETSQAMQQSLAAMQKELGVQPTWPDVMQKELYALQAVIYESMEGKEQEEALDRLDGIQHSLDVVTQKLELLEKGAKKTADEKEQMLLRSSQEEMQKRFERELTAQGSQTELKMMEKKLEMMLLSLSEMPKGPEITDVRSLHDWLAQAMVRLATSNKPGIQRVVSELEKIARDFLARSLCQLITQAQQAIIRLFTKEIELTPEEIEEGWFLLDTEYSTGTMLAGMLGGAAAGAGLATGLPWLLSKLGAFSGRETARPFVMKGTTAEGEFTRIIGTSREGPYASATTQPLEGSQGGGWKASALGAGLGAGAGLLTTLLLNPPTIAKRREEREGESVNPNLTKAGRLYVRDGKGIILSPDEVDVLSGSRKTGKGSRAKREVKDVNQRESGRPKSVDEIRSAWTEDMIVEKVNNHLQKIHKGAEARMGPDLNAEAFIRKYIQDILDAHPEGRGKLTSPDSKLNFRPGQSGEPTHSVSLMDLATGKFNYLHYNPVWEYQGDDLKNNPAMKFRKALLPDASRRMTRYGSNLQNKKPGKGLPDRIVAAFEENLTKIDADEAKKGNMAEFYETLFKLTAGALAKDPQLAPFKQEIQGCASGTRKPFQISFWGDVLSEVVAINIGNRILAWDAYGTWKIIPRDKQDEDVQEWVIKHLDANTRYKYKDKNERNEAFKLRRAKDGLDLTDENFYTSPIATVKIDNVGSDTLGVLFKQAKSNMNSMVSTRGEYFRDGLIDAAFIAINIALSALLPGIGGITGWLLALLISALLAAGKGLTKAALSDNEQKRQEFISNIPTDIISGIVIDGGVPLGMSLAKKTLSAGNIKIPWAKELDVVKDVAISIPSDVAANNLANILNEHDASGKAQNSVGEMGSVLDRMLKITKNRNGQKGGFGHRNADVDLALSEVRDAIRENGISEEENYTWFVGADIRSVNAGPTPGFVTISPLAYRYFSRKSAYPYSRLREVVSVAQESADWSLSEGEIKLEEAARERNNFHKDVREAKERGEDWEAEWRAEWADRWGEGVPFYYGVDAEFDEHTKIIDEFKKSHANLFNSDVRVPIIVVTESNNYRNPQFDWNGEDGVTPTREIRFVIVPADMRDAVESYMRVLGIDARVIAVTARAN